MLGIIFWFLVCAIFLGLGIWVIWLAKKSQKVLTVLLWWFLPPYPIGLMVARLIPKDEACGFSGFCVGYIIAAGCSIAWLILCPIAQIIYFSIKNRKRSI